MATDEIQEKKIEREQQYKRASFSTLTGSARGPHTMAEMSKEFQQPGEIEPMLPDSLPVALTTKV